MDSVIGYYSALLHKPLGTFTLIDAGAIVLTYIALAFGISAIFTLLTRAK